MYRFPPFAKNAKDGAPQIWVIEEGVLRVRIPTSQKRDVGHPAHCATASSSSATGPCVAGVGGGGGGGASPIRSLKLHVPTSVASTSATAFFDAALVAFLAGAFLAAFFAGAF